MSARSCGVPRLPGSTTDRGPGWDRDPGLWWNARPLGHHDAVFPRFPRAWLVALTAGVLLAAGVALSAHGSAPDTGYLLLDLCVGLSCAVVAGLVLSRRPGHVVGRLLAVAGLGLAMQAAAGGYAVAAHQGGWPAQSLAFWLTKWVFFVGLAPLLLLPMVLPDGRLPSPAWRPVLALLVALSAVLTVLLMLRDQAWAWGVDVPSPLGNLSTDRVVAPAFGVVMVTFAAADAAAVLSRLRGGPEVQRRQMYPPWPPHSRSPRRSSWTPSCTTPASGCGGWPCP